MKSVIIFCCLTLIGCSPPEPITPAKVAPEPPTLSAKFASDRPAMIAEMNAAIKRNGQFRTAIDYRDRFKRVADPEFNALAERVAHAEDRAMQAVRAKLDSQADADAKKKGIRIGMTADQVRASMWGKPRSINATTTAGGTREQWVYGNSYLYFENGVLTTIQN